MRFFSARQHQRDAARHLPAIVMMGLAVVLAAASLLLVRGAAAEPYLAVREGYKCSKCHVNKTGGNARTDYAKVYAETRLAASDSTGGEDYGTGRLSPALNVSADLRQFVEHRQFHGETNEGQTWQFGRRSACEGCHASSKGGGKLAEMYGQFEPLPGKASIVIAENFLPQPTTREAYGLLELGWANSYVKAGSFRMPTALRNTWDDPYIHGNLEPGSAVTDLVGLVSVRGDGVEIGAEPGPFSVSFSVTNSETSIQASDQPRDKRVHLNAYAVGKLGMLGATWYRDPFSLDHERVYNAIYGGTSVGRFTGLVELDKYLERTISDGTKVNKESLLGELDYLVKRGHNIKLQYEAFDPDTSVDKDRSDRTSLIYEPFLTPYLQLRGGVRRWEGPRQIAGYNGTSVFFEVHLLY
jgi:hypothetical protein